MIGNLPMFATVAIDSTLYMRFPSVVQRNYPICIGCWLCFGPC
ncbi:uncharacterized protein PgNI_09102 [Pyricularia grisea]|uniref:Uncharacterized protein n=1 Tax=Pyricularia grisea TaxID=148305 RepID=A0A6P8ATC9_PYRGI|nr:uncharacterized protein PgNI_09102 [Pyricularia grisea]TLD05381.1 hypothetical protein PgNI_09102 [Pyricularia grisea]